MIRTNFFITEQQLDRLRVLSEKTGLPVAELVRRAIDAYLKAEGSKEKKERF